MTPNEALPFDFPYRVPADLRHVVSATTLQVLESGNIHAELNGQVVEMRMKEASKVSVGVEAESELCKVYRRILQRPVVKKDVQLEHQRLDKPTLDISLPHVCLWFFSYSSFFRRKISHFILFLITDSSLQSSENSSHCRNQPSANHPQVFGDEQSTKFAVLLSRTQRRIEDGINKTLIERIKI